MGDKEVRKPTGLRVATLWVAGGSALCAESPTGAYSDSVLAASFLATDTQRKTSHSSAR